MSMILGKNVLRAAAFALACFALAGQNVNAAALSQTSVAAPQVYSTGGTVLGSGITGTNVISFTPVVTGAYTSPSALSLGEFQVATLPAGEQTSYSNTPFTITYNPVSVNGANYAASTAPITITGTLSGAITGSQSSVVATFNSISSPVFTSADGQYLSTLSVLNSPLALVPSSAGGITTIQGNVTTTGPLAVPAPEPTTMAILLTSVVGFGLRKKLRSGRKLA